MLRQVLRESVFRHWNVPLFTDVGKGIFKWNNQSESFLFLTEFLSEIYSSGKKNTQLHLIFSLNLVKKWSSKWLVFQLHINIIYKSRTVGILYYPFILMSRTKIINTWCINLLFISLYLKLPCVYKVLVVGESHSSKYYMVLEAYTFSYIILYLC